MKGFKVTKSITDRSNEVLKSYLKDVSHIPMISHEEEIELAKKISKGDKVAFDRLVTANLRFVISVAKQYQGQGLDLMDLINEGNLGLIKAAEKFDASKGFKFISYAVWWIRQSIMHALSSDSRTIRLPVSQSSALVRVLKAISKFEQDNERKPSNEELSKLLNLTPEKIEDILTSNTSCVSVDTPFGDEEEGCLLDVIPNHNSPASDVLVKETDKNINIDLLLDKLTIRESDILTLTFGLKGVQAIPYEETGKRFGLTGERIRQICLKTLETIRKEHYQLAKELL